MVDNDYLDSGLHKRRKMPVMMFIFPFAFFFLVIALIINQV